MLLVFNYSVYPNGCLRHYNLILTMKHIFVYTVTVGESGPLVERWKWSRPNARVYTLLIQGLAASLRVSDALSVVKYICEVGVSPSEEVGLNNFLVSLEFFIS